ncbi:hypothetical protein SAMN06265375_102530 [Muriicola jejuensis]|uniref:Uncharacterized protein n=1 Tax=Muriicola jejuensis TaxID=504488 RepID=A0A6P0UB87_9FLAO|nr:hypothetical protein [Muriicola jejuensis]NER10495.1 hypothetical protein [Muriicola jejuensis]SMP18504.1 hypothetical protein SAMN06265375_102530 [Muriicola jejuensis]
MKKFHYGLFFICLAVASCVEQQNFDQFDDLEIIPTVEASILYVESPESVINDASGAVWYIQTFNFDAFNEQFFADNVLDGVITYELENTTSKPLEILFEYLDDGGNILDSEFFSLDPAPTAVLRRETAYGTPTGRNLDIIRNTSGVRVNASNLGDTTSISILPDPMVIFRSSGKFRLRLK